jgi:hypothetical protein
VGAIFSARALAVQSTADDVSAQSADSLNITGSTAGVTPQPSAERGWLSDFHVSGFVSQTFGMWRHRGSNTPSAATISTSRPWLQVDENWRLNQNRSFFGREWFISDDLLSMYVSGG